LIPPSSVTSFDFLYIVKIYLHTIFILYKKMGVALYNSVDLIYVDHPQIY
jgi:hypothetical protein